jgi:CTP synthase
LATKYIFITGGVVSSLGKGITASSIGRLLKSRGLEVLIQKFDPYINVDPGTMSPYQHGEVFVTEDGGETDLDLGHYERFVDINVNRLCNTTTGKIYWSVIQKERRGEYNGSTVQVIPHITNEIKMAVFRAAAERQPDVVITEIGGTVGDIESLPFLEAIRQLKSDVGRENVMYIHVTLVPYLQAAKEVKTKPTQHSVKELRSIGIQPDAIVCRSEKSLSKEMEAKVALFCDIEQEAVIQAVDAPSIYELPLLLKEEGLDDIIIKKLGLECQEAELQEWEEIVWRIKNPRDSLKVALIGKYVDYPDAYLSVTEALCHAGIEHHLAVEVKMIAPVDLENSVTPEILLKGIDCLLIPGGYGDCGREGKLKVIRYAREKGIPFLGICSGMQLAILEYAQNVVGMVGDLEAKLIKPVEISTLAEHELAGSQRKKKVGSFPCVLKEGTKAFQAYGQKEIAERHRHYYEFNSAQRQYLEKGGLVFSGLSPHDGSLVIMEISEHPWFVGCQFHPEFKSRPNRAHPLFRDFLGAALKRRQTGKHN